MNWLESGTMANIFINRICNLRCKYCFANDLVTMSNVQDMTLENFKKAVMFISKESEQIGIMGGEPLLHPQFDEMLEYLRESPQVSNVIIFTNGILLDKYLSRLRMPKFKILINCNSQESIGEANYLRLKENIRKSVIDYKMKNQVCLGLNIFNPNMKFTYIIDLLREFNFRYLRLSITVPNFKLDDNYDALNYFYAMKPITIDIIKQALAIGVTPLFDCNKPPICWLTQEERSEILSLMGKQISNVVLLESTCYPVVDILSDLSAVRCMGFSTGPIVKIDKFSSLEQLRNYFFAQIDVPLSEKVIADKCVKCSSHMKKACNPGCLVYKDALNKGNHRCK